MKSRDRFEGDGESGAGGLIWETNYSVRWYDAAKNRYYHRLYKRLGNAARAIERIGAKHGKKNVVATSFRQARFK